jgi:hypothetical protein
MRLSLGRCPALELALVVLFLVPVCALAWARAGDSADTFSLDSPVDTETIRLPVVDGKDIRFARSDIARNNAGRVTGHSAGESAVSGFTAEHVFFFHPQHSLAHQKQNRPKSLD